MPFISKSESNPISQENNISNETSAKKKKSQKWFQNILKRFNKKKSNEKSNEKSNSKQVENAVENAVENSVGNSVQKSDVKAVVKTDEIDKKEESGCLPLMPNTFLTHCYSANNFIELDTPGDLLKLQKKSELSEALISQSELNIKPRIEDPNQKAAFKNIETEEMKITSHLRNSRNLEEGIKKSVKLEGEKENE